MRLLPKPHLLPLLLAAVMLADPACGDTGRLYPAERNEQATLEDSATSAFYGYLKAIDDQLFREAHAQVLDPGHVEGRGRVVERLLAFMNARRKTPVRNEAVVVRTAGEWALVVYQYDTTVGDKPARVITTAWMIQRDGYWRQFIVAPADASFWDARRSDYEQLQRWFDDHAAELASRA